MLVGPISLLFIFNTCICVCVHDVHECIHACSYVPLWVYMHMCVHAYGGTKLMLDVFLNGSLLTEVWSLAKQSSPNPDSLASRLIPSTCVCLDYR